MATIEDIEHYLFGAAPLVQAGPDVNGNMSVVHPINPMSVFALTITLVLLLVFMWFYCSPICCPNGLPSLRQKRKPKDTESRGDISRDVNKQAPTYTDDLPSPILSPQPVYVSIPNSPAPDYSAQFQLDVSVQPLDSSASPTRDNNTESFTRFEICSSASIAAGDISVQSFSSKRSVSNNSVPQPPTAPLPVATKAMAWGSINDLGTISNVLAIRRSLENDAGRN